MVPFLRQWHEVGFGLMGEQGGRVDTCRVQLPHETLCEHRRQGRETPLCPEGTPLTLLPRGAGS